MSNLSFLQDNEDFLSFLDNQMVNKPYTILHDLDYVLKKHNIKLVHNFILKDYLAQKKVPELNSDLLELFFKAKYPNEKIAILEYLCVNEYDKALLKDVIQKELQSSKEKEQTSEIELYIYDLNNLLKKIRKK